MAFWRIRYSQLLSCLMQAIPCKLANGVSAPLLQHYIHDLASQIDAPFTSRLASQGESWSHWAAFINILIHVGF
jgi:hypothetical protein